MKKDFMSSMRAKTSALPTSLLSTEENIKSQIQVLDQLRDLIPPLAVDEFSQLEQNLLKHGIKDPLSVWETTSTILNLDDAERPMYVLIDGHNRFRISQQHKLDYRINLLRFTTLDEVKDYMIDFQLGRRNLSSEQIAYLRGLRYLQQKSMRGGNKLSGNPKGDVAETLGKEYGVSSRTIKRDGDFAAGLDSLEPQVKQDILSGKQKVSRTSIEAITKITTDKAGIPDQEKPEHLPETIISRSKAQGRVQKLEETIRVLASGDLTLAACEQLLLKTKELVNLLGAK